MPVVRYKGVVPAGIAEGSGPADWIANLHLEGDLSRLAAIETAGPAAAFFSATWDAALGIATLRPDASLDYEGFSAAGTLPEVEIALRFVFNDGTRQENGPSFRVAVLDRDDTPPAGLAFASGGDVAAGEIGAVIGTLSVSDPDSAGPFHVSFTAEDDWRFEVVDGVLKLRDGITLGWDDMPVRPILVEVSDGTQSAAFLLEVAVTEPAVPAYTPPLLAVGETRTDVTLVGPREALTMRPVEEAVVLAPDPAGVRQVVIDGAGEVWLGPVDRLRFADGWLGPAAEGPAAQAAAMHRAILGEDADGAALAPIVASLRAGAGWVEVAEDLLDSAPALAVLDDVDFVSELIRAALGTGPGAESLSMHTARLAGGVSRAQLAADIALSPAALARLAETAPEGHWVAEPFDQASGLPIRPTLDETTTPAIAADAPGWFM
ncbi:MAG: hypothetical protein AVDCRST_MAG08-4278 [uncultured Acetobacteraceae bacterium]|uniref:Cadherin domain-containing protein n=1 Tax=uncultured Acetobacteraceae bacterium TaxID=169975 RepID=A0A6J4JT40_9PROT|nr:MAG: hypothetical protein AVDCRST_MAG08-4278 [uncultured Acetobacteraceae bacterium]